MKASEYLVSLAIEHGAKECRIHAILYVSVPETLPPEIARWAEQEIGPWAVGPMRAGWALEKRRTSPSDNENR